MQVTRRTLLASAAASALAAPKRSRAQARTVRIGVLNDQSGPYRNTSGALSVAAVRQAVQDAGDLGFAVEVLVADHQNKPDVGAALARQWIDRDGVDMVIDVPTSSVALAVNSVVRDGNKVYVNTGSAAVDLTGAQCTRNTIHWGGRPKRAKTHGSDLHAMSWVRLEQPANWRKSSVDRQEGTMVCMYCTQSQPPR